ncbi:MAG: NAD(P)/FAD-dependent oxidoreductase [Bacteroidota bacterium]
MKRSEFLKLSALFGLGGPILNSCGLLSSGSTDGKGLLKADEKVIVIGAGAAGLTAAYFLAKQGVEFSVLEAKNTYGGRIESLKGFTDFTIPLGAEWLHTTEPVLEEIVDDTSVKIGVETTAYDFEVDYCLDAASGKKINLKEMQLSENDLRFTNSSWIDFYEQYILPGIQDKIRYKQIVKEIDYRNDLIIIKTDKEVFSANRVIVTVPVTILKDKDISFVPTLPQKKLKAIEELDLYSGFKCFIAFENQFYPTFVKIQDEGKGPTRAYFDAAYAKGSKDHILGLVAAGEYANPYLELNDSERIEFILKELDEIFDGQASPNYIKHTFKNWRDDPFAKGTYYPEFSLKIYSSVKAMAKPVENKLFFAGDLYANGNNGWSMVHVAAKSAKRTVEVLLGKT